MDLFERQAKAGQPAEETLEGTVERIVFSGGEGAFTVARFKVQGGATIVTVVGSLLGVPAGAALRVQGRYETTARFGEQFRVARYTEVAPATLDGIRRYLGSGLIKGIGPEFAGRIVERFGIETLEILDSDRLKRAEADVKRQACDANLMPREIVQHRLRQMETCGGRSNGDQAPSRRRFVSVRIGGER